MCAPVGSDPTAEVQMCRWHKAANVGVADGARSRALSSAVHLGWYQTFPVPEVLVVRSVEQHLLTSSARTTTNGPRSLTQFPATDSLAGDRVCNGVFFWPPHHLHHQHVG